MLTLAHLWLLALAVTAGLVLAVSVRVYRMVSAGTIEEQVVALQQR